MQSSARAPLGRDRAKTGGVLAKAPGSASRTHTSPRPVIGRGERELEPLISAAVENLFDISGKTALVTGGSRGIGLMIARGYAEAGVRVYVSSRKADVCDEVAAELSKVGTCFSLPADLAQESECARL